MFYHILYAYMYVYEHGMTKHFSTFVYICEAFRQQNELAFFNSIMLAKTIKQQSDGYFP